MKWTVVSVLWVSAQLLSGVAHAQTTWYVDVNGNAPGSGSLVDPYTSIQFAIDQASTVDLDRLEVAAGTYFETIDYNGKSLEIVGTQGADVTRLDGQQGSNVVTINSSEGPQTALRGFTVTGGHSSFDAWGAAVHLNGANLWLDQCILTENENLPSSSFVAGIYAKDSDLAVTDCRVEDNGNWFNDPFLGGAMQIESDPTQFVTVIRDTQFIGNRGGSGGAIRLSGKLTMERCLVQSNAAFFDEGGGIFLVDGELNISDSTLRGNFNGFEYYAGGAIYQEGGTLSVSGSEFLSNAAQNGAAIAKDGGNATIEDCRFASNRSFFEVSGGPTIGGAIRTGGPTMMLSGCLFVGNFAQGSAANGDGRGGAIFGDFVADRCTFYNNESVFAYSDFPGGAAYGGELVNCILWGNTPDQASDTLVTYSDVQGGFPGLGNISVDPLFLSETLPDFHLQPSSPCIDAGDPNSPTDTDGSVADMGAFPFDASYLPPTIEYCEAKLNSQGCLPTITSTGTPTITGADDFQIQASDVLNNKVGLLIWGPNSGELPFLGGTLCLGAPFARTPVTFSGGSASGQDCSGTMSFDFSQAFMAAKSISAYDTISVQWYYRDNGFAAPNNVGLTGGLRFTVTP